MKHGTLVLALVGIAATTVAPSSAAVPGPTFGGCQVFPNPPAGTPANAKSLPTQAAWNQDISKAPRDRRLSRIHFGSAEEAEETGPRPC